MSWDTAPSQKRLPIHHKPRTSRTFVTSSLWKSSLVCGGLKFLSEFSVGFAYLKKGHLSPPQTADSPCRPRSPRRSPATSSSNGCDCASCTIPCRVLPSWNTWESLKRDHELDHCHHLSQSTPSSSLTSVLFVRVLSRWGQFVAVKYVHKFYERNILVAPELLFSGWCYQLIPYRINPDAVTS